MLLNFKLSDPLAQDVHLSSMPVWLWHQSVNTLGGWGQLLAQTANAWVSCLRWWL